MNSRLILLTTRLPMLVQMQLCKQLFFPLQKMLATGTDAQSNNADKLLCAWDVPDSRERFTALTDVLFTQADEPRSFKPTKKQDAESFLLARDLLFDKLQTVRDKLSELEALRMNHAALHCGTVLLLHYQELKLRSQQMDFTDLEWQVCHVLNQSDCAEYMQYKLDSRYKHVLLDEFQDTNPLQVANPAIVVFCGCRSGFTAHCVCGGRSQAIHLPFSSCRCTLVRRGARVSSA
ncbi:MAG: UvrD-helicase domain-containing protein [Nitrosomonadales bacterium]